MQHNFKKGFTLVEILIVTSIIVLLIIIVLPKFSQFRDAQILQNATLDIYNALNKAKSNTLASLDSDVYGVHFESVHSSGGGSNNGADLGGGAGAGSDVALSGDESVVANSGPIVLTSPQIVIFKGSIYAQDNAANEIIVLDSRVSSVTVTFANETADVYFNRIYGTPSTTGTLSISVGDLTKIITIGETGSITIN